MWNSSLIILHFVMEGNRRISGTYGIRILRRFFRNESTTLYYNEIKYDLKSNMAASRHANRMQEIVRELKK